MSSFLRDKWDSHCDRLFCPLLGDWTDASCVLKQLYRNLSNCNAFPHIKWFLSCFKVKLYLFSSESLNNSYYFLLTLWAKPTSAFEKWKGNGGFFVHVSVSVYMEKCKSLTKANFSFSIWHFLPSWLTWNFHLISSLVKRVVLQFYNYDLHSMHFLLQDDFFFS